MSESIMIIGGTLEKEGVQYPIDPDVDINGCELVMEASIQSSMSSPTECVDFLSSSEWEGDGEEENKKEELLYCVGDGGATDVSRLLGEVDESDVEKMLAVRPTFTATGIFDGAISIMEGAPVMAFDPLMSDIMAADYSESAPPNDSSVQSLQCGPCESSLFVDAGWLGEDGSLIMAATNDVKEETSHAHGDAGTLWRPCAGTLAFQIGRAHV